MTVLSFIFDGVAVLLMINLLIMGRVYPDRDLIVKKYFKQMIASVVILAVVDVVDVLADLHKVALPQGGVLFLAPEDAGWMTLDIVTGLSNIYLTTVFLYFWFIFLSWRLYHDKNYLERQFWRDASPLLFSAIILTVNIFIVLFTDKGKVGLLITGGLFFLVRLYYFVMSFWYLWQYRRQNGKLRFFNVWAFYLPVFAGWVLQDALSVSIRALGTAIGVTFLYRSLADEVKYFDRESGFYNRHYVDYLIKLIEKNDYAPKSALIFDFEKITDRKSFFDQIRKILPDKCEPIRYDQNRLVVLTGVEQKGPLKMVLDDVKQILEIEGASVFIKSDETAVAFMERVL